jgi:hypothetical protein
MMMFDSPVTRGVAHGVSGVENTHGSPVLAKKGAFGGLFPAVTRLTRSRNKSAMVAC